MDVVRRTNPNSHGNVLVFSLLWWFSRSPSGRITSTLASWGGSREVLGAPTGNVSHIGDALCVPCRQNAGYVPRGFRQCDLSASPR
jgi:hypothetical protein